MPRPYTGQSDHWLFSSKTVQTSPPGTCAFIPLADQGQRCKPCADKVPESEDTELGAGPQGRLNISWAFKGLLKGTKWPLNTNEEAKM